MPPVSSPGSRVTTADRAARVRFRRALALMAMTLVVPGSAQLTAGNRRVGSIALRIWASLLGAGLLSLVVAVFWHELAFWFVTTPWALNLLRLGLILLAIGWAYLFVDAWRIGQPLTLAMGQRRAAIGVNGLLCLTTASVLLFSAHLVGVQRSLILTLFSGSTVTGTHDGRYNVLLLGGDSGAGRWGLRTDSMTVASIDATTGKTVLIGLPRNMERFPFSAGSVMHQQFPHGFPCEDTLDGNCELNSLTTWAGDHQALFANSKNPGIDATISAIEGITGLKINYWAMVNLDGFKDLVNAVGGVTLDVRQPIPVGGLGADVTGYIAPGTRKLDGMQTLWFARSRDSSDDYSRMARQKCVMNAMLHQISPETAVTNFESIAKASGELISTDIPASEVDTFINLALKAKAQNVATVSLVPPQIVTAHPDIAKIHRMVAQALSGTPAAAHHHKTHQVSASTPVTGGSIGTLSTGYAANQSQNLGASC